jgi:hypothetical protein
MFNFSKYITMWRKATIDNHTDQYLKIQLETEKKEEKELKAKTAEEDRLIALEKERKDKIRIANLNEQIKVRGWCSVTEKEDKLL